MTTSSITPQSNSKPRLTAQNLWLAHLWNKTAIVVKRAMECVVCAKFNDDFDGPGGFLYWDDLVVVMHDWRSDATSSYLGHLLVCPRRHATDFGELEDYESGAVGRELSKWTRALKCLGATRLYVATIGHGVDHLHVHLLPRWSGTPEEVAWHAVDEWPGARRGDFAVAAEFVASLVDLELQTSP